ncbi:MAG TPA: STN and carboxypeptidase regulatory-like domain-containing protein, partial [Bacteroidales bacterium]|nr:STN and carboxypeptidase regulatory-like domain-containing protein [Bacteroidales bacterium]
MKNRYLICYILLMVSLPAKDLIAQSVIDDTVFFTSSSITVADLLDTIHARTGINFSYDPTRVPVTEKIAVHFTGQSVEKVLHQIFQNIPVGFIVRGRQIAIFRRNVSSDEITENPVFIEIRGMVMDRKSGRPVPFASIVLSATNIRTITNEDGVFTLKIPAGSLDSMLTVSCIGYESLSLSADCLITGEKEILLNPVHISIREVIVRPTDPPHLLLQAVKAVPERFMGIPVYLTGYFRELTWKDGKCIALSESVTRI